MFKMREKPVDITNSLCLLPFRHQLFPDEEKLKKLSYIFILFIAIIFIIITIYFSFQTDFNFKNKATQAHTQTQIHQIQPKTIVQKKIKEIIDTATTEKQKKFLSEIVPYAIKLQQDRNIPASAIISVAIYESRYGQSFLAQKHNNYFGIKALSNDWKGEKIYCFTKDEGEKVVQPFRVYPNKMEGLNGFCDFLQTHSRYKRALQQKQGSKFVKYMLNAGYCPDDDYLQNIHMIINRHKLGELDEISYDYCFTL